MSYFAWGLLLVVMIVLFYAANKLGGFENLKKYFSTKSGKKIAGGIIFFVGFGIIFAFLFSFHNTKADEIKYFDYGKVYLGLDYVDGSYSPMCMDGEVDNKLTSNGGLIVNIIKVDRFEFNTKFTHHSCALNDDDYIYNAGGFSLEYQLW